LQLWQNYTIPLPVNSGISFILYCSFVVYLKRSDNDFERLTYVNNWFEGKLYDGNLQHIDCSTY
jgi:hypothetical protein